MPIDLLLRGRSTDVGGLPVTRVLPHPKRRFVGPFVFVDHLGPATIPPHRAMDVRPHPHIGLATVTYLFAGAMVHRDSIGCVQRIEPGDVNWMTAGRGIVHSERTPDDLRGRAVEAHGVQTWVGLPLEHEDAEPSFVHCPARDLPLIERPGAAIRVIAGHAFGQRSPVPVFSETLYCALEMQSGAALDIPAEHAERALLLAEGTIDIDGQAAAAGELAVLAGGSATIVAKESARLMLLGGAPLGDRFLWWNFVASSRERIERAKEQWSVYTPARGSRRFPAVPGETEFIPLPER
ncbi:MAG TPA: pirin family protein [Burkholderiaceae bacterium]|nr:pirin family protein [Burkholderiaceae bacterium]